ncbi:MAG TPA: NADH-quinone oxidoreductase subunit NuoE [Usitatibacter sp.]|nr:NADH-quinone oxidoreductase subunit NuoE [Usitatibacter sp.]
MALLSAESLRRIEAELGKYPPEQKRSAAIAALAIAQEQHGWLPTELMEEVAGLLGMPPVAVYEVATFYNMYDLKPRGRHKLAMCTNLPCALSGAAEAAEHLKRRCGVAAFGETSPDGRFTVKEGECFGACGDAPVLIVDNRRMLGFMTPEKLDRLIEELGE